MTRPLVIAHRGASGYLPEHTLPAKALAHGQGADFLEQDVVATRDGRLIVCHDLWLDGVTDVRERYPGRARADGRHYCIDFDLAELRTLRFHERVRGDSGALRFPGRFPLAAGGFPVVTFEEELRFIAGLNHSTGRAVGIYPEIKEPVWHRRHGIELGDRLVEAVAGAGTAFPAGRVYVQCFDPAELSRLHAAGCRLPLVQLIDAHGGAPQPAMLAAAARYASAVGLDLRLLVRNGGADGVRLVAAARAAGLAVHAWTVRRDDLPEGYGDVAALLACLIDEVGVDGIFTDFPDEVVAYARRAPRAV